MSRIVSWCYHGNFIKGRGKYIKWLTTLYQKMWKNNQFYLFTYRNIGRKQKGNGIIHVLRTIMIKWVFNFGLQLCSALFLKVCPVLRVVRRQIITSLVLIGGNSYHHLVVRWIELTEYSIPRKKWRVLISYTEAKS